MVGYASTGVTGGRPPLPQSGKQFLLVPQTRPRADQEPGQSARQGAYEAESNLSCYHWTPTLEDEYNDSI